MNLRVLVRCVACGYEAEVHVQGPWDIETVTHACADDRRYVEHYADGRKLERGEFAFGFNPRRPVF